MIQMPGMGIQRSFRVVMVPQTVVVSSSGVVEWTALGTFDDNTVAELMKFFGRR